MSSSCFTKFGIFFVFIESAKTTNKFCTVAIIYISIYCKKSFYSRKDDSILNILRRDEIDFCDPDTLNILHKVIHSLSTSMFILDILNIIMRGNNTN